MAVDKQLQIIKRGVEEIIHEDELKKKLKKGKPLIVKAGFDPTVPDIHLGHTVLLRKLRHFQDCGHKVIFLIGDATALVGDPSGQSKTRKTLTWDEVEKNATTYVKQVSKILNTKDRKVFEIKRNRSWFDMPHFFDMFVELAQRYTVARLLERDDFEKRLKENKPISFLELFYPLMQGYDSVHLNADIEIGGTDQKFNMLVGRSLQNAYNKEPQVVITMPILEGLDGVNKMSKSLNNYVGIDEAPDEMFGKIMSISDNMMLKFYELLTDEPFDPSIHPKKAKENLAKIIVGNYHGSKAASEAAKSFEKVFSKKETPDNISTVKISEGEPTILELIKKTGLVPSSGEIKRLLSQGAINIDGKKVKDPNGLVAIPDKGVIIKIGKKRFAKILKDLR